MGDRAHETFHSEIGETLIDLWYSEIVRNIQKAVRQAENVGDMPPPARGCPTFGRAGVTGISACLAALFEHMHKILIIQKIHLRIYISIFVTNKH